MDFDPSSYEEKSFDAIKPAMDLIKIIRRNHAENRKIALVVDIGCGSGNTAKLIADKLNPERIVGIDIDPEMITFAKTNNQLENTEYYTQDITTDWDQWDESLRKLSGKVTFVFSNYALHWVRDIESTAKNISKLLSDKGVVVVDVLYCGDIYRNASAEERLKYEQFLKYPTEQEVMGRWVSAFKSAGLTQIDIKYWEPKCVYPEQYYVEEFIKIPIKWYKNYLKSEKAGDIDVDELIKNLIIKDRVTKLAEKSPKGEDLIEIKQELWTFVVKK